MDINLAESFIYCGFRPSYLQALPRDKQAAKTRLSHDPARVACSTTSDGHPVISGESSGETGGPLS